jgi:ABC-type Fe3+-siderophore transport system permease subunit
MEKFLARTIENRENAANRRMLLLSGLISAILYVVTDIIVSLRFRVTALLIGTTASCLLALLFFNPNPDSNGN